MTTELWGSGAEVSYANWVEGEPNALNLGTYMNGGEGLMWTTIKVKVKGYVCEKEAVAN